MGFRSVSFKVDEPLMSGPVTVCENVIVSTDPALPAALPG